MKRPVFRKPSEADRTNSESTEGLDSGTGSDSEDTELEQSGEPEIKSDAGVETTSQVDAEYVTRLEGEVKENYDKYLRAVAELENYKKRAIRERSDLTKYAGEHIARDLLEILDNFQLAMAQNHDGVKEDFLKGIKMIYDRFIAIMEQHSIRGESVLGKTFDPNSQQALASVPTDAHAPNTVIEEFKRAYYFKDKLLRPAQVVVSISDEAGKADSKENEPGSVH